MRIVASALIAVAGFDLVVAVIPMPEPPRSQTIYLPGGGTIREEARDYSSTEVAIIRTKNWTQVCLNPVGWVALFRGYGPDTLYQLRRNKDWSAALDLGQWLTVLTLIIVSMVFFGMSVGRKEKQA